MIPTRTPPIAATQAPTPTQRLLADLARERAKLRTEMILTGLTGVGLAVALIASSGSGAEGLPTLAVVGYVVAYLAGGLPTLRTAVRVLVTRRRLTISLLMVLAAIAAALVGEVRDGAILLLLFSLAESLEGYAMGNAKRAVASLMKLRPETATIIDGATRRTVPAESVTVGQRIAIMPGERIPLDGVLVEGLSSVDQSPITGESVPVDKAPGDPLFAGTVNGYGALEVEVTKDASSTTLARMIDLVTEAQSRRSPSQRFSAWFGQRYTHLVLLGSVVALGAFLLLGMSSQDAFYKAATLLVVASPCAVVISVPAAVLAALARAARMGVLFKGGAALEDLGAVETFALDKTGTLTEAKMRVTDVAPFGMPRSELLRLAAAIESDSQHPVAAAVRAAGAEPAAGESGAAPLSVSGMTAVPGMGVTALVDGRAYWAGNRKLAGARAAGLEPQVEAELARLEALGRTIVIVGTGDRVLGIIAAADTLRPSARQALSGLRAAGVRRIVMLTGDNAIVAGTVARELGIASSDVYADLLPEQKVERVKELRTAGKVAVLGDGVNDAAAMATATVGIAMGAAGTDAALEAADVALLSNDLARLPDAMKLAREANRVIRQNLTFALGIMAVMVVATLFGDLPLPLAVLGHEGGTILVVMNGLRLLGYGARRSPQAGVPVTALGERLETA
ncbi:MAG TPA: heavy metal translocating P-type ATPase [Trueperaceae bacterium]|nr:heavy metal translocating P-type ATPase [Trueperaceae bacterium]